MKLLDYSGLQRFLSKIKTLLDSKANTGHTHVTSEVTDLLNSQHTWSAQQSYSADLNLNYANTDVDDILDAVAGSYTAEDFLAQNNVWTGSNTWTMAQFCSQNAIHVRNAEPGVAPSSEVTAGFRVENANASYAFCDVLGKVNTSGVTYVNLVASNKFSNGALDPNGTTASRSLQVGIRPDGSGFIYTDCGWRNNLVPPLAESGVYSLGTSTNQWKSVYAQSYYYNGTAWGLDKANEWTNDNTFKGIYQNQGDTNFIIPRGTNTVKGDLTTSGGFTLMFKDKNNGNLATSGIGYLTLGQNSSGSYATIGVDTIGSTDNARHTNSISLKIDPTTNDNTAQFYPVNNNATDLGTSTNQWRKVYSADVVHTSGNETITGVKTLIDYWRLQAKNLKAGEGETYGRTGYSFIYTDKNDVEMGDVTLFKNANAARTFIRIRGGDYYTNGAPAAAGTLVQSALMVGTNVSGKKIIECDSDIVYPTANNATDLGDSTHQWNNLYAKNYYYNGTAWGLDKANEWTSYQQMSCNPTVWNMKNTSITLGTKPSSNRYLGFIWYDSADTEMGRMCFQCHKNGSNYYLFSINNSDGTNTYNGSVRMSATRTGAFTLWPDAGTWDLGSSSNQWANIYGTNLYSTHGTFTDTITVTNFTYAKNGTLVKGTQPTKTLYTGMYMCDKNGTTYKNNALGMVENSVTANNVVSTYIRAMKNTANNDSNVTLGVAYDTANSLGYTFAPTPAVADNSTKIATTTWVTVNRPILAWASRSAIVRSGTEYKRASGSSLFCGYFSDGAFNYTNDTPRGVVAAGTYELYGSVSPATGSTGSNKIFGMWIRVA